jgi:hypothetical protein
MLNYNIPKNLWEFVLPAIVRLINYTATDQRDITPFQEFHDFFEPTKASNIPDLSKLKTVGSPVYVHNPKELQTTSDKLEPKAEKGIMLSYSGNNIYTCYLPTRPYKPRIVRTSHLRFLETLVPEELDLSEDLIIEDPEIRPKTRSETLQDNPGGPSLPGTTKSTQSKIEVHLPNLPNQQKSDYQKFDESAYAVTTGYTEPKTVKQALNGPDRREWLQAIHPELRQIIQKGTLQAVDKSFIQKEYRKLLSVKWGFKRKLDENGNMDKYKARLIVRVFEQTYGIDYNETFASETKPLTWRILLDLLAYYDWKVEQIDIIGAFLNGELTETIYIDLIDGIDETLSAYPELNTFGWRSNNTQALRLLRALYELKQNSR